MQWDFETIKKEIELALDETKLLCRSFFSIVLNTCVFVLGAGGPWESGSAPEVETKEACCSRLTGKANKDDSAIPRGEP